MKDELKKRDILVEVLTMPNSASPKVEEWVSYMQEKIMPNEHVFLMGHSLGGIAILKYLESLNNGEKIGGIVLVAGFSNSLGIGELENFFTKELEYAKIKNVVNKSVFINSDNDPFVPLEEGRFMKEKLGGKLVIMKGAYHINEGNGFFNFPTGLKELLKIME
jgi:predicted alpha/beta hydrolase family esterase